MKRLYEAHLPVQDLVRSVAFYRDVVGLGIAFTQPERGVVFLWIGGREDSMLGLWAPGSLFGFPPGSPARSHIAIQVTLDELVAAIAHLRCLGITPTQFGGEPASEPSVIGWMPSAQVYFSDPDGHSIEYIALLDDAPDPDFIGSWSQWKARDSAGPR